MELDLVQIGIFVAITALIAWLTYVKVKAAPKADVSSNKDYFLAGGGLSWVFVAGSITLTNLSTDQLVGMNGNQMLLIAWWELAAVLGLFILAFVFVPIYYRNQCTTTTELLEKRYNARSIRTLISVMFLFGNIVIYLPAVLYTGALFMQSTFSLDIPIVVIAAALAVLGAAYAIFGGLRAVAVSDTYSGIGLLGFALLVVFLSLQAIDFDLSGIPAERLSMAGGPDSPIPWPTLLTGMLFIQIFYWSTNQTITQRAMAAPTVREAQKGVIAAAAIRLLIVPLIIAVPGVAAYQLFGDIGDATYGRLVDFVMPPWLSGAFAAFIAAASLTTFNSILNSSAALYVCDIHEQYFRREIDVPKVSAIFSLALTAFAVVMVPVFQNVESIINTLQWLNGLFSMPILSAFIVGLLFRNVDPRAAIVAVISGVIAYGLMTTDTPVTSALPIHYIHVMAINLVLCVVIALGVNVAFTRQTPKPIWA